MHRRFRTFIDARLAMPVIAGLVMAGVAVAWSGPPGIAPTCPSGSTGCAAPLDTSANAQTKTGTLSISVSSGRGVNVVNLGNDYGIYSTSTGAAGIAVRGDNASTGAWGTLGYGSIGVRGTGSSAQYGGYFVGGYGVYGEAHNAAYIGVNAANTATGYYTYLGYNSYSLYGNGYGYLGGTLSQGSDARLKESVQNLPGADGLSAILKLRPIIYNWKDVKQNEHDGTQMGFIAQEVKQVLPNVVTKNGTTTITLKDGTKQEIPDTLGVDYARLVVPLVKAVQEQNETITKQQQEIDALKAQVATLTAKLGN